MAYRKMPMVVLLLVTVGCLHHSAQSADFSASLLTGYKGGTSFRISGMASEFAQGFPLAIELGLSYTTMDPGDPALVRRIFINDATNGTPEKYGLTWDFRLDFLYKVNVLGLHDAFLFTGVRYSMFAGDFHYVGGNEDFQITTNQWGFGTGARVSFPVSRLLSFTFVGGFEYYIPGTLYGHDTSYSPNGDIVNQKHEYVYRDAAAAVNQPKFQPLLLLGLTMRL